MKTKVVIVVAVVAATFGMMLAFPAVSASEHNDTDNRTDNETVEIGVGQSLSVAIDSVSSDVGQKVSEAARNRELGAASSESERAEVLAGDLNETIKEARTTREEYKRTVEQFRNGEITKSELVTKVAKLSNRGERVEKDLKNVEYAAQYIPQDELNDTGVTQEKIDEARREIGVVGSSVAKVAKNATLNPSLKVGINANETGMSVDVEASEGKVYRGVDKEKPDHGEFNVTEEKARQAFANRYNINLSEYKVEVERDDDGYYEIEAENERDEYEAVIDGRDGSFVSSEEKGYRDLPEDAEPSSEDKEDKDDLRGPPEGLFDEDDTDSNASEGGKMNRSERGDVASGTQGPPPWAQYDEEPEETEEDEEMNETEQADDDTDEMEEEDKETEDTEKETEEDEGTNRTEQSDDDMNETEEEYNLTEEEAIDRAEKEGDFNASEYDVNVTMNDGDYKVVAENENGVHRVLVDGGDGEIEEYEYNEKETKENEGEESEAPEQES